jgi:hypothetical protein
VPHDVTVTTFRAAAAGRLAAHRGDLAEAVRLADRGVAVADGTDMLNMRALAWLALAEVQETAGKSAEADAAHATALALYEQKGNVAAAEQLRREPVGA